MPYLTPRRVRYAVRVIRIARVVIPIVIHIVRQRKKRKSDEQKDPTQEEEV